MRSFIASLLAMLLTACPSATLLRSVPDGANVYADGKWIGQTPLRYSDAKIAGSVTNLRFMKDGYEDTTLLLARNEQFSALACLSSIFLLYIPLLWIFEYQPEHSVSLRRIETVAAPERETPMPQGPKAASAARMHAIYAAIAAAPADQEVAKLDAAANGIALSIAQVKEILKRVNTAHEADAAFLLYGRCVERARYDEALRVLTPAHQADVRARLGISAPGG